jgi:hypothetical protein
MSDATFDLTGGPQLLALEVVDVFRAQAVGQTIIDTQTLSEIGEATFDGLEWDQTYVAVGRTSGRRTQFRLPPDPRTASPTGVTRFHVGAFLAFSDPVQEAMTAAADAGGGEVTVPEGTWTRSATLEWGENVTLKGAGPASVIHYTGSGHAVQFGSGALDVDDPWTRMRMRDVNLTGTASATSAIRVRGATRWRIEDVTIDGFTGGAGILLNGASFLGKIDGGRITNCERGISARKVTADGAAGEGQAFNAIEVCGQLEIQDCDIGIELGDPVVTETAPVVGMGASIHNITVQSCTDVGIWNVSANRISVRDCYFEGNPVHIRQGSDDGNTSQPVLCSYDDNFLYIGGPSFPTAIEFLRGIRPRWDGNYVVSEGGTTTAYVLTANVTGARYGNRNYENGVTNRFSGAAFGNFEATASVASAASVTIPAGAEFVLITGTTNITSMAAGYPGQRVTLIFAGALTFTDGSNLHLAGNLVTTGDDTISLVADATDWYETSRSVN